MPRGKNLRRLHELPSVKGFRPLWMRPNYKQAVSLQLEEYEALRLLDYENLTQKQAAEKMNVSRPTVTRIYEAARKKIATAIVEGRSFFIEGGTINIEGIHYICEECQHKFIQKEEEKNMLCPECGSNRIICISNCFIKGCKRCRRCQ